LHHVARFDVFERDVDRGTAIVVAWAGGRWVGNEAAIADLVP